MRIQPIIKYSNNYNYNYKNQNSGNNLVSFKGKLYPSGYYDDAEIECAKESLKEEDWKIYAKLRQIQQLSDKHNEIWFFFNYNEQLINKYLYKISCLRSDLINEEIEKKRKQQEEIFRKTVDQAIMGKTKKILTDKYLSKLLTDTKSIPTAILISGNSKPNRENVLNWICKQSESKCRIEEYDCPDDIEKLMYYLETEKEYCENRYKKSKIRTLVKLNDFDQHLKDDNTELKDFLFSLSEDKSPMTIIFGTEDAKELSSPFIGNARRIPIKIDMTEKLAENEMISAIKIKPNEYDGYKFQIDNDKYINLYLGDFGYSDDILWVESENSKEIKIIIQNIKAIKNIDKFKNVKFIQCPIKDYREIEGMTPIRKYTKEYKQISQYKLG